MSNCLFIIYTVLKRLIQWSTNCCTCLLNVTNEVTWLKLCPLWLLNVTLRAVTAQASSVAVSEIQCKCLAGCSYSLRFVLLSPLFIILIKKYKILFGRGLCPMRSNESSCLRSTLHCKNSKSYQLCSSNFEKERNALVSLFSLFLKWHFLQCDFLLWE